jgi:hypothetical protein
MKFGFFEYYDKFFTDTSDSTDRAILKNAIRCPTYDTCSNWTIYYHNISTILNVFDKVRMYAAGKWTDEENRPIACEIEGGGVETSGVAFWVSRGSPLLEFVNDAIDHINEGGIFSQIMNLGRYKFILKSKFVSPTFEDTYYDVNVSHLQTAFYLLLLGYGLAVVCFVSEIMWHRYRCKGRGPTSTSVTDRHT